MEFQTIYSGTAAEFCTSLMLSTVLGKRGALFLIFPDTKFGYITRTFWGRRIIFLTIYLWKMQICFCKVQAKLIRPS